VKRGLGTFAKGTLATLAALALSRSNPGNPSAIDNEEAESIEMRMRLVDLVRAEEGNGEEPDYWLEAYGSVPKKGAYAWCGVFALWALRRLGLTAMMWQTGPKAYGFIYPCKLPVTRDPKPGDIAYFTRNQHHAIVLAVDAENVTLCNGNGAMGRVSIGVTPRKSVASFFSIQPLINSKLAKIKEANS
jgi:hypothetical protein